MDCPLGYVLFKILVTISTLLERKIFIDLSINLESIKGLSAEILITISAL